MGAGVAASSSIDNGFEYHYEAVAKAAGEYEEARAELDPLADEVKRRAGGLFDEVKDALAKVAGKRPLRSRRDATAWSRLVANTEASPHRAVSTARSCGEGAWRAGGGSGRHARRRLVRRRRHRGVVAAGRREGPGEGRPWARWERCSTAGPGLLDAYAQG